MLFFIFVGMNDKKRIDAASLLQKYQDQGDNKQVIEHIIDQIWTQYDYDNSGSLDKKESYDFLRTVLTHYEKSLA